jgi:hypothetical protein
MVRKKGKNIGIQGDSTGLVEIMVIAIGAKMEDYILLNLGNLQQ